MEFFCYYLDFMASDLQYCLVASFGSMWFNRIIFKCKKKGERKEKKQPLKFCTVLDISVCYI